MQGGMKMGRRERKQWEGKRKEKGEGGNEWVVERGEMEMRREYKE